MIVSKKKLIKIIREEILKEIEIPCSEEAFSQAELRQDAEYDVIIRLGKEIKQLRAEKDEIESSDDHNAALIGYGPSGTQERIDKINQKISNKKAKIEKRMKAAEPYRIKLQNMSQDCDFVSKVKNLPSSIASISLKE
jgi:seryl-tRNA synthetase